MKLGKSLGLMSVVLCSIWLLYKCTRETYPVKVSFEFRYAGQYYRKSYFTITTKGRGSWPINPYSWSHGRDKISVALSDGSIVILRTPWQYFDLDPPKVTIPPTKTGWIWLNNASAPTELISGGNYSEQTIMPNAPSSFPQFEVTATIERMSWKFYLTAEEEDQNKDDSVDRLLYTNFWGGPLTYRGLLFAGLLIFQISGPDPLSQSKIDEIRDAPGWISLSDSCKVKPLTHASPLVALTIYAQSRELRLKDGIWTATDGPSQYWPTIL